jgi:tRNA threonylcarbamoyladenosine biosynthesis protein TsaE
MVTVISPSPEATFALGEAWGREAQAGWLFALTGDLGSGKTQLVRGLAHGLGVPGRVHSPTFALVSEMGGGRLPLAHLDLYRLETAAALLSAGLEEYFVSFRGVTVVEWAERWFQAELPVRAARIRRVTLETLGEHERRICHDDAGA